MNAIRVLQLRRGPADLRSGTLWPKCHSLNCFQLWGDCRLEIEKGPRLSTNWNIDKPIHDIDYGSHQPGVQCTVWLRARRCSSSPHHFHQSLYNYCNVLLIVSGLADQINDWILSATTFGRLCLVLLVSFRQTGVNTAKMQINHREMTLLWF